MRLLGVSCGAWTLVAMGVSFVVVRYPWYHPRGWLVCQRRACLAGLMNSRARRCRLCPPRRRRSHPADSPEPASDPFCWVVPPSLGAASVVPPWCPRRPFPRFRRGLRHFRALRVQRWEYRGLFASSGFRRGRSRSYPLPARAGRRPGGFRRRSAFWYPDPGRRSSA